MRRVFLPFILGGVEPKPMAKTYLSLPGGHTAHLENPQAYRDRAGVIFAATRPSSGVGGLVWKQFPDGRTELVFPIDPEHMYALGELVLWPDGYLYYVTVEQGDHSKLVVIPVPGWTR